MAGREPSLRLHAFAEASRANGPGLRAVVWTQGCSLGCPGCFNPATHPFGGDAVGVDALVGRIVEVAARRPIEGVTVSGGEPLQQRPGLVGFLERLRSQTSLSTLVFTGYTREEVAAMVGARRLLACVDVLVAGRYDEGQPPGRGLRGSANQVVHLLTDRYSAADIDAVPDAEVVIDAAGGLTLSGVDPLRWS